MQIIIRFRYCLTLQYSLRIFDGKPEKREAIFVQWNVMDPALMQRSHGLLWK